MRPDRGILAFFHKVPPKREMSPPTPKRAPSPAHEYVLADNQDIAVSLRLRRSRRIPPVTRKIALPGTLADRAARQFIVMFRNRFSEAFPKSLANFGPQELERDVADAVPGERVEQFLCATLKLLLNRQQDVKSVLPRALPRLPRRHGRFPR